MIHFLLYVRFVLFCSLSFELLALPFSCLLCSNLGWWFNSWDCEIFFRFLFITSIWMRRMSMFFSTTTTPALLFCFLILFRCILTVISTLTCVEHRFLNAWMITLRGRCIVDLEVHPSNAHILLADTFAITSWWIESQLCLGHTRGGILVYVLRQHPSIRFRWLPTYSATSEVAYRIRMWPLVSDTAVLILKISTEFGSSKVIIEIIVPSLITTQFALASLPSTLFIYFILHIVFICKFKIRPKRMWLGYLGIIISNISALYLWHLELTMLILSCGTLLFFLLLLQEQS